MSLAPANDNAKVKILEPSCERWNGGTHHEVEDMAPRAFAGGDAMENDTMENQVWAESRVPLSIAIAMMLRPSTILAEPCTLSSAAVVQGARVRSAAMEAATTRAATTLVAMPRAAVVRVAAIAQFRSRLRDDLAVHPTRG